MVFRGVLVFSVSSVVDIDNSIQCLVAVDVIVFLIDKLCGMILGYCFWLYNFKLSFLVFLGIL